MSSLAIARRYAKALMEIGVENGSLETLRQELASIQNLVRSNADLQRLVSFPLIPPSKRAAAFDAVLERAGASRTIRRFFLVLTQAARLTLIFDIVTAFDALADELQGVVEAQVASPLPLSDSQAARLATLLGSRTGKTVRLRWRQDPGLLGGLKVQVGSTVFDASLAGQLRQLKSQLLSA